MTAPFPAASLAPEATLPLVLAVPKGRILGECAPLLARAGVEAAPDLLDEDSRRLRFPTSDPMLDVVRVRPFDVATFVAFGAAQVGICGADVLMEFDYSEIYAPLDLGIGQCRVSVAEPADAPRETRRAGPACASRPNTPPSPGSISPGAASRPRWSTSTAPWSWRRAWASRG